MNNLCQVESPFTKFGGGDNIVIFNANIVIFLSKDVIFPSNLVIFIPNIVNQSFSPRFSHSHKQKRRKSHDFRRFRLDNEITNFKTVSCC